MKFLLLFVGLCGIASVASAGEVRAQGFHRRGDVVEWHDSSEFPQVTKGLNRRGSLVIAQSKFLDSIEPYDFDNNRPVGRAAQLDDLYYESLLLADPLNGSERMYPLIARAIRFDENLSYVVFEIDPRARFQDGTPVRGDDLLYSFKILKESSAALKDRYEDVVHSVHVHEREVRVELRTSGQASRDAIVFLASVKVVKPNTTGATEIGGIRARFTPTGPYRLTHMGRAKISLVTDPAYWAKDLSVRRGFFHFRVIEVAGYPDEMAARMAVAKDEANYFFESQAAAVRNTQKLLKLKNANIRQVEQSAPFDGARIPALTFNLKSAMMSDWRVRRAIALAYDFQTLNQSHNLGALARPLSLFGNQSELLKHEASPAVAALMQTCQVPPTRAEFDAAAEHYDKRFRLQMAARWLHEAGFKMEGGFIPLRLRILVRKSEQLGAHLLKADLAQLGINAQLIVAEGEMFATLLAQQEYDLASFEEGFLDKEGRPNPSKIALHASTATALPCLKQMIYAMEDENPNSQTFHDNAEALARVHAALRLSVFTGAANKKTYFLDERLTVPNKLSVENMHLYGYWLEPEVEAGWTPAFPFLHRCVDIGCMLDQGRP